MATTVHLFAPPPPAPGDADSNGFMIMDLLRSGLSPSDLGAYPIASSKYDAAAYVIPYQGNDRLWRARIDREENKYISATNVTPDIWIPPGLEFDNLFEDTLYVVEGEKKAAAVYKNWDVKSVVGIGGCWNAVIKNKDTESYRLIERLQMLCTPGRRVHLILDGDVIDNKNVGRAALTLRACIEQLNATMYLFRPPSEWKGVDDWIYQDPKAVPAYLESIDYDRLSINRTLLYQQLSCSLNADGALILNELNALKLLEYHFKSQGLRKDKRLGFIDSHAQPIDMSKLNLQALEHLQGDISPRYGAGAVNGAFVHFMSGKQNETDLVRDMVKDRLQWDGVERLESWGSQYFASPIPKLADEWGRLLITGLVMRILEPGCKVDTVTILNGPQGIGKTTFFEELAMIDKFSFYKSITDLPGSMGDDRTFKQTLVAALVVDLGEGVIFESRKTSSDRLKQFLTDRFDEYRVAYAKTNTITPRGYIFVGTTNRTDQLTDYTGSRRFLYLNTTKIRRLPYPIKLQLMAEVVAKYGEIRQGPWYDLRLTMDDLPQQLKDEHKHVVQVNELLNVEHYRTDTMTESIRIMIDSGDPSRLAGSQDMVVTAAFIAARMGQAGNVGFTNMVGRKLIELGGSPIFPYTFEKTRKRGAQVDFKPGQKELYTGHITNDQVMFTCFIVKGK